MSRFARFFVLMLSIVSLAGMVPQANAQVVVRVGPRHRHHHHGYYRHDHRHYR